LLDSDDFGGIEDGMVGASSDEPTLNSSSEPSLMPSIQSKLRAIFEAICNFFFISSDAFTDTVGRNPEENVHTDENSTK
jgi:hypothetical protein